MAEQRSSSATSSKVQEVAENMQELAGKRKRISPAKAEGVARRYFEAIDARDLDAARALLDSGAEDPGGAVRALLRYAAGGNTEGLAGALPYWNRAQPQEEALWALAASGDGLPLATWLRRDGVEPGPWLRLGAAHVRAGREELSAWLRHGYREPAWRANPRALLASAVLLRRAAERIGDAEAAATERAIAARLREALLRRDVAVPLAILGRM